VRRGGRPGLPLLAALLLLPACVAEGTPPTAAPAPPALELGDRWFVAWRKEAGPQPVAERSRRTAGDGFVRDEVTWARSFGDLAGMEHGTAQVLALRLGEEGLTLSLLDGTGRPAGPSIVEVAAPFRAGTAWEVANGPRRLSARIVSSETVETPGGPVEALRVEHRALARGAGLMTTWYDRGLRPVRAEIRGPDAEILEARAALASPTPTPEECRAALEWARRNLQRP
jgi:hypothetical protein